MEKQRTIAGEITFSGKALQTGVSSRVRCLPADTCEGIIFKRKDLDGQPEIKLRDAVFSTHNERRTTAGIGPEAIQTVEHFLAALWGEGIDNILVEVEGGEMPALDGSAAGFLEILGKTGTVEQDADREIIRIDEELSVKEPGRSISISPYEGFKISYLIDYSVAVIGRQIRNFDLDKNIFKKEIAPARTFCMKQEAEALLKAGLGQGADYQNTLVLDEEGPIETVMRFEDEPLRHKVLDLIGDLYMLGLRIKGEIRAERSGHKMNARLLGSIYEKYVKNRKIGNDMTRNGGRNEQ